jgi:hypothetical protein
MQRAFVEMLRYGRPTLLLLDLAADPRGDPAAITRDTKRLLDSLLHM